MSAIIDGEGGHSYDDVQIGARLVTCATCGQRLHMTAPRAQCFACVRAAEKRLARSNEECYKGNGPGM